MAPNSCSVPSSFWDLAGLRISAVNSYGKNQALLGNGAVAFFPLHLDGISAQLAHRLPFSNFRHNPDSLQLHTEKREARKPIFACSKSQGMQVFILHLTWYRSLPRTYTKPHNKQTEGWRQCQNHQLGHAGIPGISGWCAMRKKNQLK